MARLWRMVLADHLRIARVVRSLLGLAAMGAIMSPSAQAQDEAPDLDFLEYLGSWQESDEEWLAVAEWEGAEQAREDASAAAERKDDENDS